MKKISTLICFIITTQFAFSQSGSETFTTSGLFTVPESVTLINIEVLGAGGSGGGNGTGGGGGGGYAMGEYEVSPGDALNITVGTAGSGATTGTTSAGTLISATGGENGVSVSNPNIGGGGAPGIGSGGTIFNSSGGLGGGGYYTYFGGGGGGAGGSVADGSMGGNTIVWNGSNCLTPGGDGGVSGGAPGGNGGKGAGFTDAFCTITDPASSGINYGGGGGGGNGNGGGPGSGAGGYCRISWGIATGNHNASMKARFVLANIFTNTITIKNANGNDEYELISAVGEKIWTGKNIEQHDFSFLATGFYLLKIRDQKAGTTIKLFKQ